MNINFFNAISKLIIIYLRIKIYFFNSKEVVFKLTRNIITAFCSLVILYVVLDVFKDSEFTTNHGIALVGVFVIPIALVIIAKIKEHYRLKKISAQWPFSCFLYLLLYLFYSVIK